MEKNEEGKLVLHSLTFVRDTLDIIHNVHEHGELCTYDKLYAASYLTQQALAYAVESLEKQMVELERLFS